MKLLISILMGIFLIGLVSAVGTIELGSGVYINMTEYVYTYDSGGAGYSANLYLTDGFDLFPDAFSNNDAIYFGNIYPLLGMNFSIDVPMAGTGYTLNWQYYSYENGINDWTDITDEVIDGTNGFTQSGIVNFTNVIWGNAKYQNAVNSDFAYFSLRVVVTGVDTPTEGGHVDMSITQDNKIVWLDGFTSANPVTFYDIYENLSSYGVTTAVQYDASPYLDASESFYFIPFSLMRKTTMPNARALAW